MESTTEGNFYLGSDFVPRSDDEEQDKIVVCTLCKETISDNTIVDVKVSNDFQETKCWKCVQSEPSKTLSSYQHLKDELLEGNRTEMEPNPQEQPEGSEKQRSKSSQDFTDLPQILITNQDNYCSLRRRGSLMVRGNLRGSPSASVTSMSMITDFCDQHAGKITEYYCTKDCRLLCSVCMSLEHNDCVNRRRVEYIPTYVENIDINRNLKEIMEKINDLTNECKSQKDAATKKITCITEMFRKVTQEIDTFRKNINHKIDELEKQILDKVRCFKEEGTGHFIRVCEQFDNTIKELRSLNFELLKCQQSRNEPQSFVVIKKSEEEMLKQKRVSGIYNVEENFDEYYFETDKKLELLLDSVTSFGCLRKKQRLTKIEIEEDGMLNVRSKDDKKLSWITGLAVLSESRIAVADHDNQMVKLIDTQNNLVLSVLRVPTRLHDVATILCNQFAATLPYHKRLQILSVYEDELCIERSVKVSGKCHGITFSPEDQYLCITMLEPACVQILQLDGTVVREISQGKDNKLLFSCPEYISVSKDGKYLYVSDYDNDSMTMLSSTGKVVKVFQGRGTEKELEGPKAVYVSQDGYVFLCGGDSNNVIILTNNCEKYKVILTHYDGLQNPVCFGELRQGDRTLLVVNGGWNSLKLFKFE